MLRHNDKKRHMASLAGINSIPSFTSRYAAAVLADNPIVYWPGQEISGQLRDLANVRPNLDSDAQSTLTFRQAGPFKDASYAITKGSGGKCTRSNCALAVNNVTLEGWFNLTSGLGSNRMLMSVDGALKGWGVLMTSATHYAAIVQGVAFQANNTAALSTGIWYHIVVVRDGGTWKYYLNGAGDNTSAGTGLPVTNDGSTSGNGIGTDSSTQVFNWAHFAYYETALSSARALAHYNAGVT